MAQGDGFGRALGGQDPGQARHLGHPALLELPRPDPAHGRGADAHPPAGPRFARGGRATRRPASKRTRAGTWALRPERFLSGSSSSTSIAGRETVFAPCMRSRAARTNRSKVTWAETGLPGRPKTSLSPRRPKTRGAPGLIATLVKSRPTSKRAST